MKTGTAARLVFSLLFLSWVSTVCMAEPDRSAIKVSASSWEQKAHGGWGDMPPERSLDGDLKTAWMAEGDGEWIQFDFGEIRSFTAVKLAFAKGNERVYTFDILVSETGTEGSWKTLLKAAKNTGKQLEMEVFEFKAAQARYIRIVGHGNSSEKFPEWCNITEADFDPESAGL